MSKNFQLDIVTPTRTLFSGEVQSVSAPGDAGNFQVLFNHAPLLSSLAVGQVKVIDTEGKKIVFSTSGGFMEVKKNKVILLAETAERADAIDVERAEKAKARAQKRIAIHEEGTDNDRARLSLLRSLNRLKTSPKM